MRSTSRYLRFENFGLFLIFIILSCPEIGFGQYTDIINSNRPGQSSGAYAVGIGVVQFETGYTQLQWRPKVLNALEWRQGLDIALRTGVLNERLEVLFEGQYQAFFTPQPELFDAGVLTNSSISSEYLSDPELPLLVGTIGIREGWTGSGRLGLKYLIYDRFKDPERNKPNLYSWRANNVFQLRNLIPSVALYAGTNYIPKMALNQDSERQYTQRIMAITQSRLSAKTVLITNVIYDGIGTTNTAWNYLISYSQNLNNPRWSWFLEGQKYTGRQNSGQVIRAGAAYLFHPNFQLDVQGGYDWGQYAHATFFSSGISYRLDFHQDPEIIEPTRVISFGKLSKSERRAKQKAAIRNRKRNKR